MAKSKKNQNPIEDEMAEIYAEIEKAKAEKVEVETTKEETVTMTENKTTNEVVVAPAQMRIPTVVDVKEVPDETLEVYNLMRSGYSKAEIRAMRATWKQKKFNAIYDRAKELVKQNVSDIEDARADIITKYQDLYRKAYKISNIKACKEILDSCAKIMGLNREINVQADIVTVWKP